MENTRQAFYKISDLKVLSIDRIRPKLGFFDRSSKRGAVVFFEKSAYPQCRHSFWSLDRRTYDFSENLPRLSL